MGKPRCFLGGHGGRDDRFRRIHTCDNADTAQQCAWDHLARGIGGHEGWGQWPEPGVLASCFTSTLSRIASSNMVAPGLVWLLTLKLESINMRTN